VRIPSNATVAADRGLNFSGAWNGTFYVPSKACADPVWHLFDLLTNNRYGLGRSIEDSLIDKWNLYECSVYNNQMLPTGLGYSERRYSCNTQLQSGEKAWEVINAFCSACHMKPYWSGGIVKFWQDRPATPVRQFTQADISGRFTYSSTAIRARHTVARVTWNDPEDEYQRAVETVEDVVGINKYGIREIEIAAFGCTSRALAIRVGRWALYSSRYETRSVSFTARSFAAYCRPGEVIQVADDEFANIRYGGLIAAATATTVTLDSPVVVGAGFTITVMLPSGALQTRTISGTGVASVIAVTAAFSEVPLAESNWIVRDPNVQPQTFRVVSVAPKAGDPTRVEINAIEYNPSKYAAIESQVEVEAAPTRFSIPTVVTPPAAVTAGAIAVIGIRRSITPLVAGWTLNAATAALIKAVYVEYSRDGITWQDTRTVIKGSYETRFEGVSQGTYFIRVAAIDLNGKISDWRVSSPVVTAANGSLNLTRSQALVLI
jgi:predicted phage tail protein